MKLKVENGKLYGIKEFLPKKPKQDRTSAGECPYCRLPVYVSEGQSVTYRILKNGNEVVSRKPTHKLCRKNG